METKVTCVRFYDEYDVDYIAIYVDGKKIADLSGYEVADEFEKILGMILLAIGDTLVRVDRKYIRPVKDEFDFYLFDFPESL